jgi:hypothetical protein
MDNACAEKDSTSTKEAVLNARATVTEITVNASVSSFGNILVTGNASTAPAERSLMEKSAPDSIAYLKTSSLNQATIY